MATVRENIIHSMTWFYERLFNIFETQVDVEVREEKQEAIVLELQEKDMALEERINKLETALNGFSFSEGTVLPDDAAEHPSNVYMIMENEEGESTGTAENETDDGSGGDGTED